MESKVFMGRKTSPYPYWFELHGDRLFRDDPSILSGIARIEDTKFIIIAQEKGRGTKQKLFRNFGMALKLKLSKFFTSGRNDCQKDLSKSK